MDNIKVVGVGELQQMLSNNQLKKDTSYIIINKKKLLAVAFLKCLELPEDIKVVASVQMNVVRKGGGSL